MFSLENKRQEKQKEKKRTEQSGAPLSLAPTHPVHPQPLRAPGLSGADGLPCPLLQPQCGSRWRYAHAWKGRSPSFCVPLKWLISTAEGFGRGHTCGGSHFLQAPSQALLLPMLAV